MIIALDRGASGEDIVANLLTQGVERALQRAGEGDAVVVVLVLLSPARVWGKDLFGHSLQRDEIGLELEHAGQLGCDRGVGELRLELFLEDSAVRVEHELGRALILFA